jgi:O-antigen biosynthesis protein WbqP
MTNRMFNLFFGIIAGLILITPMLIISLLIIFIDGRPIIHWSKRIGKNNTIFLMPKFRTMYLDTPQVASHLLVENQTRITALGRILRKTSLDELPQIWSILKGDMNFIGPRPALFNQDDLINLRTFNKIHLLKPGITGWAQINGRDDLSIEAKVRLELEYLKKKSLFYDLKIIILTIYKVLLGSNINH